MLLSRNPMLCTAPTLGGGSLTDVVDDDLRSSARLIGIYSDMHTSSWYASTISSLFQQHVEQWRVTHCITVLVHRGRRSKEFYWGTTMATRVDAENAEREMLSDTQ